jgi:hypothetical protein
MVRAREATRKTAKLHSCVLFTLDMVRAREATRGTGYRLNVVDIVDRTLMPPCPLNITTGTIALLFKPRAIPSVKAAAL